MLGMPQDTINRDTQDWQRIEEAVAFRMPEGDELLIMRKVACPTCNKPVALVLADETTIGYARRHGQCGLDKIKLGDENDG
ncbi:hypothetical protein phiRKBJ001_7 [Streptomyces phage phiRKBJ001]|nr:hypothetical protein phiRKBJ001_7 [Streptomyces phage phiRKBJ001]